MTTETRLFSALVLLVLVIVVATVAYDIYLHPPGPNTIGMSIIEIEGTEGIRVKGTIGTVRELHAIEASTPVTFKTPYTRADYVAVDLSPVEEGGQATLKAEIKKVVINAKDKTVEKEQAAGGGVFLIWEPPHSDGES
jgi:hypothetical protein